MEDSVGRFCAVTGSSPSVAARFLNVAEGDIDHAIAFYFDSDQSEDTADISEAAFDESRTPIPQRHERLVDPDLPVGFSVRRREPLDRNIFSVDPQQKASTSLGNTNGNEVSLKKMFEPPTDILFNGTFEEAKELAKDKNAWLLVSVHNNEVFDCHRLNRDLWKNPKVKNIVKRYFVFWQVLYNKTEAQHFVQWYNYNKDAAHLAILDPVTGECKMKLMGNDLSNTNSTIKIMNEFVRNNSRISSPSKKRAYESDNGHELIDLSDSIPKIKRMKIISPSSSSSFGEAVDEFEVAPQERWYDYMGRESDPIFTILLRLPSGERDLLSLPSSSKLKALFLYIYEKGCEREKYEFVRCFPKTTLSTLMENMSLESCGIVNRDTLHVQERM